MKHTDCRDHKGPHRDPDKERFWRKTLKEQADSGQGVRAFCRARGLAEPSFYAWRRTIAERDCKTAPRHGGPTFVELHPRESSREPGDVPLEIVVGARRLLIRPGIDAALLREVLAALGE